MKKLGFEFEKKALKQLLFIGSVVVPQTRKLTVI